MSQVWLQHNSGQNVGDQLHSRNTSTKMLTIVYNVDRRVWSLYFSTPLEATGRLPHVGIAADKVSDKRMRQWQCNAGRVNFKGSPTTLCTELRKMGLTAKGVDCYENMCTSASNLSIKATQRRTYCFDGEAVYSGDGTTADTCRSLLKAEDEMNEVLRDPPHGGESLQDDMRTKFPYVTETVFTLLLQRKSPRWHGDVCCFDRRRMAPTALSI